MTKEEKESKLNLLGIEIKNKVEGVNVSRRGLCWLNVRSELFDSAGYVLGLSWEDCWHNPELTLIPELVPIFEDSKVIPKLTGNQLATKIASDGLLYITLENEECMHRIVPALIEWAQGIRGRHQQEMSQTQAKEYTVEIKIKCDGFLNEHEPYVSDKMSLQELTDGSTCWLLGDAIHQYLENQNV